MLNEFNIEGQLQLTQQLHRCNLCVNLDFTFEWNLESIQMEFRINSNVPRLNLSCQPWDKGV
jgi:hypothetical protein